jgi:hypothetical protein
MSAQGVAQGTQPRTRPSGTLPLQKLEQGLPLPSLVSVRLSTAPPTFSPFEHRPFGLYYTRPPFLADIWTWIFFTFVPHELLS